MAKAKGIKINYKDVKAQYVDGELVGTVEIIEEETEMAEKKVVDLNLTEEMKDLLASLKEDETISINVKRFKPTIPKEKKPVYKYTCGCGKEIKTSYDGLDVTCNSCGEEFLQNE